MKFVHDTLGQRVLFGQGLVVEHVGAEARRLGARKVMLIASPREDALAARLTDVLQNVVRIDDVRQHVPLEHAVRIRGDARDNAVDLLVAVGGGSATGLAKAVALTEELPIVAVPTTYSGSEGTNVWGLTDEGVKRTGVSAAVLPTSIVYDTDLSRSLPVPLSVASGLNALAHSVDALWAPAADPINRALALEATRAISESPSPPPMKRPVLPRCTERIYLQLRSHPRGRHCITRSAIFSVERTVFRTRRRTR